MLQNFSQTQGTVFHSSACISSSESFFKNRSAHFSGKSPSSGACSSQIAILLSLGLKFLMKWKPTYIYGDLNFSEFKQVFANLFSWRKLEGSLIISWKFQGRTPQEIWITAIFPARSKVVSYDVLHHSIWSITNTSSVQFGVYPFSKWRFSFAILTWSPNLNLGFLPLVDWPCNLTRTSFSFSFCDASWGVMPMLRWIEWVYRLKSAGSMSRYLVVLLALKYFHIQVFIVLLNLSTTTAFPSLCVLYISMSFSSKYFLNVRL